MAKRSFEGKPCPDCGVEVGQLHVDGCDIERCPECGGQRLFDFCRRTRPRLPWTGEWPGDAECREYGLWCKRNAAGPGWVPCDAADPDATEDLNRLAVEFHWDADRAKFVPKTEDRAMADQRDLPDDYPADWPRHGWGDNFEQIEMVGGPSDRRIRYRRLRQNPDGTFEPRTAAGQVFHFCVDGGATQTYRVTERISERGHPIAEYVPTEGD